jgi:hypothetical protein
MWCCHKPYYIKPVYERNFTKFSDTHVDNNHFEDVIVVLLPKGWHNICLREK